MNTLLKEILTPDTNASAQLYRLGEPFSITDQMGPLGSNDWVQSWKNFRNGKVTNNDASRLWENIEATMDFIGESVYSRITNYIDNIADIDFAGLKGLMSMLQMIGYDIPISIKYSYPTEIRELMDILSINRSILLNSSKGLNSDSRNYILASMLEAREPDGSFTYPSLIPTDFRELWTTDLNLHYIVANDIPSLTANNLYHSSKLLTEYNSSHNNYDVFFSNISGNIYTTNITLDIEQKLKSVPSLTGEIIAVLDGADSNKVLAYIDDVSTVSSWTNYDYPSYELSTVGISSTRIFSPTNSIFLDDLKDYAFIKGTSDDIYYGVKLDDDVSTVNSLK